MTAVCIAGVFIAISIFLPWWGMKFLAPQYPEGLDIIVYLYKMDGRIDIINGLNHYIGMKPFSEESFPELSFLPYVIGAMALLTIVVGLLRNMKLLYAWISALTVGGIVGVYDIHRWLKDFGTNLDPKAPIDIEPFIPPIIGENTIANFVTHSYFTYGALVFGVAFILILYPIWKEKRR
jgi:copper chaperone NosL